ncbi:MAG TPA: RtcB family protein [Trebonia sp.]|jgi:RNA-splicing ligase RtcB
MESATSLIDEDPRAYKDIRQVMEDQSDLTGVVHRLTQVLNYKGTG